MRAELVRVTPELAIELLGRNLHNRNVRTAHVQALAGDITNDRWLPNGETIKIAADGTLVDGQHRLHAVVEAGIGVDMLVVRGVTLAAQETIDTGRARTFADALRLRGEPDALRLASATRIVWEWLDNGSTLAPGHGGASNPSHATLAEVLRSNPDIREAARVGAITSRHVPILTGAQGALIAWTTARVDAEDSTYFLDSLVSLAELRADDPILALRQLFQRWSERPHARPDRRVIVASTIKAWNAFRAGVPLTIVVYRPGGKRPEPFPSVK